MIRSLPLAALALAALAALPLAGCTSERAARADLGRAAIALDGQLAVPSRLAAAALLQHARTGRFPETPFALLGSREAAAAGLDAVSLSALRLDASPDGLDLAYTLRPTAADPADQGGTVRVAPDSTGYRVDVTLDRAADADFGGAPEPLATEGPYAVVRARAAFFATAEGVAEQGRAVEPPLQAGKHVRVRFDPLAPAAAPPALRDGLTIVLTD